MVDRYSKWIGDSILSNIKSILSSTLLFFVYAIILFIVFISLSAHEVQSRITGSHIDGRPANLHDVLRDTPEIRQVGNQLDQLISQRNGVGQKINDLNQRRIQFKNERDVFAIEAWRYFKNLNLSMTDEIRQKPTLGMLDFTKKRGIVDPNDASKTLFTPEMEKLLRNYELAHAQVIRVNREKDRENEQLLELDLKIAKKKLELQTLTVRSLPQIRAELEFFEVDEDSSWVTRILGKFGLVTTIKSNQPNNDNGSTGVQNPRFVLIGLPQVMIMIFIAIIGGALGGLIRVTETYFTGSRNPDERIAFYVARPLFGMITALTVFVLLKSGVLLVSGNSLADPSSTSLNAYFVAFASIVAGLMSENAVDTLRSAGNGLLSKDAVTNVSYANGVIALMENKKLKAKELYGYFLEPSETVDNWLTEQTRVPTHARQIIAAWLNSSPRDLFSTNPADEKIGLEKVK